MAKRLRKSKPRPPWAADMATYSIGTFCAAHGISVSGYYLLRRRGEGPREMRVGRRRLISHEAAADWRRKREAAR